MSKCKSCIAKQFNSMKSLTKEELKLVTECKTSKFFKKGEVIFKEGEALHGVFCIRYGMCKLTKLIATGKDQTVKLLGKGELLGQRSILSDDITNLSAVALNDVEMCYVPKNQLLENLKNNSKFSLDLLKHLADDLKNAENNLINMAQKSVKQRLAESLIYIYTTFGTTKEGMLKVILSREDYANIVGTATESAIRILSQFKKEELISTEGKQIKIENLEGLKRVE